MRTVLAFYWNFDASYRLFTKDIPVKPSHAAMAYYLVVLAALGFILKVASAQVR